jgi:hypothetical protein
MNKNTIMTSTIAALLLLVLLASSSITAVRATNEGSYVSGFH